MIQPPGWDGVAFSEGPDGDLRNDQDARRVAAGALELSPDWAEVRQVHRGDVVEASSPGDAGEADALWTREPGLPLAIFTADCFGVVLSAPEAVGVAHVGWRSARVGLVARLRQEMTAKGHEPRRAAIGPGIGPCCFEVGPEVSGEFPRRVVASTTWGTTSVDLPAVIGAQLTGLDTWTLGACTRHEPGWFSHRADGTKQRLATIGWLP